MHTMDKAVGRVKVRNLETAPGMKTQSSSVETEFSSSSLPNILDTAHGKLVQIAAGLGFKLGGNDVEIVNNVQHLKNLEASRLSVYNASVNKHKESIIINNNIAEGFSINEIEDWLTDDEGKEQDNEELDSMIRNIAGLGTVTEEER